MYPFSLRKGISYINILYLFYFQKTKRERCFYIHQLKITFNFIYFDTNYPFSLRKGIYYINILYLIYFRNRKGERKILLFNLTQDYYILFNTIISHHITIIFTHSTYIIPYHLTPFNTNSETSHIMRNRL